MRFYSPNIIRFYYRYVFTFILCVLPMMLAIFAPLKASSFDVAVILIFMLTMLSACGFVIIHIWFWEKFFGVLIITDDAIRWTCPFRRSRVICMSDCAEIGAYIECAEKGFPSEWIYVSDHRYPQRHMDKNGVIKASDHFIKFWYSRELADCLIRMYPSTITGVLNAYRRKKRR